jgi:hypothetical protein
MIASVNPPDRIDHPKFRYITKNMNPNRPYTIDGIAASDSALNLIIRVIILSRVYSAR